MEKITDQPLWKIAVARETRFSMNSNEKTAFWKLYLIPTREFFNCEWKGIRISLVKVNHGVHQYNWCVSLSKSNHPFNQLQSAQLTLYESMEIANVNQIKPVVEWLLNRDKI